MKKRKRAGTEPESVTIHQAKTHLSRLLKRVEETGSYVRIMRNDKPIADIVPIASAKDPFEKHPKLKRISLLEDPLKGADDDDWPDEYR